MTYLLVTIIKHVPKFVERDRNSEVQVFVNFVSALKGMLHRAIDADRSKHNDEKDAAVKISELRSFVHSVDHAFSLGQDVEIRNAAPSQP